MSLATHTLTHVTDGTSNLIGFLRAKPLYVALVGVYLAEVQDLEDALWTLQTSRALPGAIGLQLDGIGQIVGLARNGLGDADYLIAIYGQISLNQSSGLINDVLNLLAIVNQGTGITFTMTQRRASFYVVPSALVANPAQQGGMIRSGTVAGVASQLIQPVSPSTLATAFTMAPSGVPVANTTQGYGDSNAFGGAFFKYTSQFGATAIAAMAASATRAVAIAAASNTSSFSSDGVNWSACTTITFGLLSVGFFLSSFWAGDSSGFVYQSADGSAFVAQSVALFGTNSIPTVVAFASDGATMVACGGDGALGFVNGGSWTDVNQGIFINGDFKAAASGGASKFVAVGAAGLAFWTTNLSAWSVATPGALINIGTIAFGASLYAAGDAAGAIATSPTGQTWTNRTSNFGGSAINKIVFANALFVAVGAAGKISTSSDGITWTARTSNFGASAINDVMWIAAISKWVIVGAGGKVATSPDGITWTLVPSAVSTALNAVVGNAVFITTAGASGNLESSTTGTGGHYVSSY